MPAKARMVVAVAIVVNGWWFVGGEWMLSLTVNVEDMGVVAAVAGMIVVTTIVVEWLGV